MKKLIPLAIIILSFIFIFSCIKEDDDEEPNQLPSCEITSPATGQQILKGETISISVEADDSDGSITEVRFFIDGVGKGSDNSFPFNYDWNTNTESIGNHTIKAMSIDNSGGETSNEITLELIQGGSSPIANFSSNTSSGMAPLIVLFTDQSTNNPSNWQWDFGDGGTSTESSPTHSYSTEGSYTVALTVSNNYGSHTESKTDYIIVSGGGNTAPTALFTVSPSSGTTSTNFAFDASGSTDNEDPTSDLQVRWDFDGNGSWDTNWDDGKTQSHQYGSDGTYTAKLEVKDTEGLTDEYTQSITVSNGGTGTFTDPRDGQIYATVDIGSQTWMAENLNYETPNSWTYDNDPANGDIYGRLYIWEEALTVCPSGWHLPTDEEWSTLRTFLGEGVAGGKMKETGTTHWNAPNVAATNSSGFTALPGGYRNGYGGSFYHLGTIGYFWSATEYSSTSAWYYYLSNDGGWLQDGNHSKTHGSSVRCIKD